MKTKQIIVKLINEIANFLKYLDIEFQKASRMDQMIRNERFKCMEKNQFIGFMGH